MRFGGRTLRDPDQGARLSDSLLGDFLNETLGADLSSSKLAQQLHDNQGVRNFLG